jgi:hypothetical protein
MNNSKPEVNLEGMKSVLSECITDLGDIGMKVDAIKHRADEDANHQPRRKKLELITKDAENIEVILNKAYQQMIALQVSFGFMNTED